MKEKNKIVFAAQDPGGFNALCPVIKKINKREFELKVFLANESRQIAKKQKFKFVDCSKVSFSKLVAKLKKFTPDIIVAATSDGLSLEKKITHWAAKGRIPVIAIIDFWSNYRLRFSYPKSDKLEYLANTICVIDEVMKRQMIEQGFEKNNLVITGNPFFDTFKVYNQHQGNYILFASQPYSELSHLSDKTLRLNEIKIFNDYVKALEKLGSKLPIIIAFHPRCRNKHKFDHIIKKTKQKIKIARKKTEDLINNARIVIGINTIVLFQASLGGKGVVSYQPGIKKQADPLISNRLGLSLPAYNKKDLAKQLRVALRQKALRTKMKKIRNKYLNNNSTNKVINAIKKNLCSYIN